MYAVNSPRAAYLAGSSSRFRPAPAPRSRKGTSPSWIVPVLSFLISVFLTLLLTADAVFAQYYQKRADVAVEISVDKERAEKGDEVTFEITATNFGPDAAPTVWVWFDTYDTEQCFQVTAIDGNPVGNYHSLPQKWGSSLGPPVPSGNDWVFDSDTFTVTGKVVCDPKFWFSGNARITEITGAVDPDLTNNGPAVAEVHNTKADLDLEVFTTRSRLVKLEAGNTSESFDLDGGVVLASSIVAADVRFATANPNKLKVLNSAQSGLLTGIEYADVSLADGQAVTLGASDLNNLEAEDVVIVETAEGRLYKLGGFAASGGRVSFEYEELLEVEPKPKEDVRFRVKLTNLGPDRSRDIKVRILEDDPHGCFEPTASLNPAQTANIAVPVNPFGPMGTHLSLEDHAAYYPFPVIWKLTLRAPRGPHHDIFDMEFVEVSGTITCGDSFGIKAEVIDTGTAADHSPQGIVKAEVEGVGNADLQITKEVIGFDADKDRGVAEFVIKVKNLGPEPATWVRIKDLYDPNIMTFDRAYWNLDDEQFAFTPPTQAELDAGEHQAVWKINKILRGETRELRIKFFCDIKDDLVNTAMLQHVDQFDTNPDNDMSVARVVKLDYGDAPAPYKTLLEDNGARHRLIPDGPMLGRLVDVDNDGAPSDEALGDDDLDGTDDEDGIEWPKEPLSVVAGSEETFRFRYAAPVQDALLNVWIDFNDDGDWDDWGEHPVHNEPLEVTGRDGQGRPVTRTQSVKIPILPTSVNTKQTFMRVRVCSNNMMCNAYIGMADDGEVEDYQIEILSLDFGDADTDGQTEGEDAARHPLTTLFLGEMIDSDPDGQETAEADGDDTDGDFDGNGDDEDGITFLIRNAHEKDSFFSSALNSLIANVAGNHGGYLNVFLDYRDGGNGNFDANERVVDDLWVNPGDNLVTFDLPNVDPQDAAIVRFRLCAKPDECDVPTGKAKSGGEVEDYIVCILDEGSDLIVKSDGQLGSVTEDDGTITVANKDGDALFVDKLNHVGRLTVMGTKADDYLFVDPDAIPAGTLMAMLADGHDSIELGTNRDRRDLVKHLFDGPNDGSIELTDANGVRRTLFYSGLEPILDNVDADDRIFAFNGGSEDIVIKDDDYWGDGYSFIDSDQAEEVTFYGPRKSIQVMAGNGEDTIDFQGLDADLGKEAPFKNFSDVLLAGNDDADYILVTPIKSDLYTVTVQGDHPLMCYGDVLDIREDWKGTIASLGEMNGGMGTVTFNPYTGFGDIPYTGIEALADYQADLAISVITDPSSKMYYPGDAVEVTVKVTNLGKDKAQCISVPDILDEKLSHYGDPNPGVGMFADQAPRWFDSKTGENDPEREDWVIKKLLPGDMATYEAWTVVNSQIVGDLDIQQVTAFTTDPELWNNAAELGEIKPTFPFPAKALAQAALFAKTNLGKVGPNMHLGSDVQLERMIVGLYQGTPGIQSSVLCRVPDTTNPMTGELYWEGYDIVGLGNRWRPCDDGLPYPLVVTDLHLDPETGRIWLSSWGWAGLYYSDNKGLTWEKAHAQLGAGNGPWSNIYAIAQDVDGFLYISANNGNVFRSMDKGETWQQVSSLPGVSSDTPWSLVAHPMAPGVLYAGTFGNGVFVSDDYGFTWKELHGNSLLLANKAGHIFDLEFDPDMMTLFAGTGKGVYRLDDPTPGGSDMWKFVNANIPNPQHSWNGKPEVRDLAFDMMGNLYAASWGQGVFVNTNPTESWPPAFEQYQLRQEQVSFLAVSSTGLVYANTASGGMVSFEMASSGTSTAIEDEPTAEDVLPSGFALDQNYPNPFNPVTTIGFALPEAGDVRLSVFDVLGREVSVLVDGYVQAGQHEVTFDAQGLPTGTYVYRLDTGAHATSRTLVLMK